MKNGIYAAQVSGSTVRAVHIDQERIELEAMNRKVQRRLDKAESEKRSAARMAEEKKQQAHKLSYECMRLVIGMAILSVLACFGLVNWILATIAVAIGLIAFGSKLGRMATLAKKKSGGDR